MFYTFFIKDFGLLVSIVSSEGKIQSICLPNIITFAREVMIWPLSVGCLVCQQDSTETTGGI